jgi:tight adherence protein B
VSRRGWPNRVTALVRALLALAVFIGTGVGAFPAEAESGADQIQILEVTDGTDGTEGTVTMEVAVPTRIGQLQPVAANFGLTENGQRRDLLKVIPVGTTVDVMVVLDTSGSMKGPALAAAKGAAASFIEQLGPDARVGVIGFGQTAEVKAQPGTDRAAALAAVDSLQAGGETALWDALALAADTVAGLGADRPYVVVLADGANSAGSATQDQAVARLQRAGAGLYGIAIETADTDRQSLAATVSAVGGQFSSTADVTQLGALYNDIAGRLAGRYRLTYASDSRVERSVVVSVAAGDAVATANTVLSGAGAPQANPGPVLNTALPSSLGPVIKPDPGLPASPWLRVGGLLLMFVAFVTLALLASAPTIRVRLDTASSIDKVAGVNSRLSEATERFMAKRDSGAELDGALDAAGINLRPGEFVLLSLVAVVMLAMIVSLLRGPILAVVTAGLAVGALVSYLGVRTSRRRQRFADQLTDALSIMSGGLRAGRGLPQALELVAEEAPSPLSDQFRRVVFETRVGRDMTTSLLGAAHRMKSDDLEWVTRAIDINRELGGDLTEVLDNVANTIRDRRRVARQVKSLSAEGRATGWVLLTLPFLMFAFIAWRNPAQVQLLTETGLGRSMLGSALLSMAIGYFWVRKLVDIKY